MGSLSKFIETHLANKKIEDYEGWLSLYGKNADEEYGERLASAERTFAKGHATYGNLAADLQDKGLTGSGYGEYLEGKAYERYSDHRGLIPVVIVSPADSMLISESAEERRRYINAFISQFDHDYLQQMIRYNAALAERNKYLKIGSDEQMLQIYDMQLAASAEVIYNRRKEMIEQLQPIVAHYYKLLSDDRETVSLAYRSDLQNGELTEMLAEARQKDLILGHTTVGIHRDEILFTIGDVPLRKYGSQGQQKSFIIALKLAQYQIIAEQTHRSPILLLDDVFDKLDESRVAELISIVASDAFSQIIITDCSYERMERLLSGSDADYKLFNVTYGKVLD